MKTLILLRHAKAVPPEAAATDAERPLSPRGLRDADAAGAAIAAAGLAVSHVVVSPARRTMETAAAVVPHLGAVTVAQRPALYMAPPRTLWQEALESGGASVLVIAHNPGLQDMATLLLDRAADRSLEAATLRAHFPTSAFAAFEVSGETLDNVRPRLLRHGTPRG
jgi:phosphohistidine phosphatase